MGQGEFHMEFKALDVARAVIRHPFVLMAIAVVFVIAGVAVASAINSFLRDAFGKTDAVRIVSAVLMSGLSVAAYWLFVRTVERKPFQDFERSGAGIELSAGVLVGGALMALAIGLIALLGGYDVTDFRGMDVLAPVLSMVIISSIVEEVIMRGIVFRFAEMALGSWAALGLSAILFGIMHLGNDNSSWFSAFILSLEAGIMLGAVYMLTRRLWGAIGIHAGWNFTQAGIFGVPVSGIHMPGLLVSNLQGDEMLTGGRFGAEASLPALFVCTIVGTVLLVIAMRQGRIIAPSWRRLVLGRA